MRTRNSFCHTLHDLTCRASDSFQRKPRGGGNSPDFAARAFGSAVSKNQALYAALKDFAQTPEAKSLDPTRRRFLTKTLDDFRRNGAELDDAGRKRLEAIDVELTQLTTKFSQNVLDATNAFESHKGGVAFVQMADLHIDTELFQ